MTLNQLEYFCAVCRCHSITKAADELYVSQPAISVAIKKLEKEFHLRLFNHGKNSISLTREGEEFYKSAELIIRQSQDLHTQFSEMRSSNPPVRIGIPPLMSMVFFPRLVDAFQEVYDIPVRLYEYGSVRARKMLDSEGLDVTLVNMNYYNIEKYNRLKMMEDQTILCVSPTHRLAKEKYVTFDMLSDEKLIMYNTDSVQNDMILSRFHSMQIQPNILMYCSQLYTTLNFVRKGDCAAFLYSSLAVNPRDFVQIPLVPRLSTDFGMIWKKDAFTPLRTSKFIDFASGYDITPYLPTL
jgi:DNA-binding transcriptional LysR family regulator